MENAREDMLELSSEGPFMSFDGTVHLVKWTTPTGRRCVCWGFTPEEARRKAELLAEDLADQEELAANPL